MDIISFVNERDNFSSIENLLPVNKILNINLFLFNGKSWETKNVTIVKLHPAVSEMVFFYENEKEVKFFNPFLSLKKDFDEIDFVDRFYQNQMRSIFFFDENKLSKLKSFFVSNTSLTAREILRAIRKTSKLTDKQNFELCKNFSEYWNGDKKQEGKFLVRMYSPRFFEKIVIAYFREMSVEFKTFDESILNDKKAISTKKKLRNETQ